MNPKSLKISRKKNLLENYTKKVLKNMIAKIAFRDKLCGVCIYIFVCTESVLEKGSVP